MGILIKFIVTIVFVSQAQWLQVRRKFIIKPVNIRMQIKTVLMSQLVSWRAGSLGLTGRRGSPFIVIYSRPDCRFDFNPSCHSVSLFTKWHVFYYATISAMQLIAVIHVNGTEGEIFRFLWLQIGHVRDNWQTEVGYDPFVNYFERHEMRNEEGNGFNWS